MANNRGGYSKREFAAIKAGKPMPYSKTGGSSAPKATATKSSGGGISSQLKAAQKALESSYKPSAEENAAEGTLNNLITSKEMGLNKIKNEPQAMPFAVGQTRALERQVEEKAVPLKLQIATLQARRQASTNVANSKLFFLKDAVTRSAAATKAADDSEYRDLQKQKLKKDISKKTGGSGSTKSDWEKVTVEKGPTGRVRSIVERNKKTGETRRSAVK